MKMAAEARAALGSLTVLGNAAATSREVLAGGLAWYPAVGLMLGAAALLAAGVAERVLPAAAGVAGVLTLAGLAGGQLHLGVAAAASGLLASGDAAAVRRRLRARPGAAGWAVALAVFGIEAWAASVVPRAARTAVFLVAPMLGRWAIVVQCHGGAPTHARGPAAVLVGRASFREFAWASVVAFGVTLSIGQAVGLVLLVVAALATLALRVWAHRRVGGLTGRLLAASGVLVETAVFVTIALLARR